MQSDSPTFSRETLKVFCHIASNEKWHIEMSDVQAAFLQADRIKRNVFIQPPEERKKPNMVWRLLKPSYGLRDASRQWFISTVETLKRLGMTQSFNDSCLFMYRKYEKLEGLLIFHVDDFLSAGSLCFESDVMTKLRQIYTFGNIERNNFIFTGIEVKQNQQFHVSLTQKDFVDSMEYQNYDNRDLHFILSDKENKLIRKSVGQLSWLSTQTRPDISFEALSLSTRLSQACYADAKEANKVIKKAKNCPISLIFQHLGKNLKDLHIKVFADASLGGIEDQHLTKSIMGYFIALCNSDSTFNTIHWKSRVIDKVAQDVKTAETLALETALDDSLFLSNFITEVYMGPEARYTIPIYVYDDSKSLIESLFSTKKVKRKTMRVVISRIQQLIADRTIKDIRHVSTKDQLADILTKKGVSAERLRQVLEEGKIKFLDKIGPSHDL